MLQNVLVIGGNGFLGSAVCKAALASGMKVTSISRSGQPFRTPKGHVPSWTSKVTWVTADAFAPETFSDLLPSTTAVVHVVGTLLEDSKYKLALKNGDILGLASSLYSSVIGQGDNPLEDKSKAQGSYERINRDTALSVCKAFLSSTGESSSHVGLRRSFIYLSAEDIFRPIIPSRYIETKRRAERDISEMIQDRPDVRAAYIRPSLIYHSHFRPLTLPLATLLDLSSTIHKCMPAQAPTPSKILRSLASVAAGPSHNSGINTKESGFEPSALASLANVLVIPPIHVDHVAEAVCKVIMDDSVEGIVNVERMRELIGWSERALSQRPSNQI